jgi:two-component system, chemotaxis family, sensor kinase CheA
MELDDDILRLFIEDSQENLSGIENDLLVIEAGGENPDYELVNKVFRAVHSIKGSAGFVGLKNIKELAHGMENILDLIRNKKFAPESKVISVLLKTSDILSGLITDAASSNEADISEELKKLKSIADNQIEPRSPVEKSTRPKKPHPKKTKSLQEQPEPGKMPVSRKPQPPADHFKKRSSRITSPITGRTEDTAKAEKYPGIDKFIVPESFLRVNVKILDTMMTLAGEMVLTRSQLLQTIAQRDFKSIENTSHRLNRIISELQEAIISTRMQPIGNVFNKFHRVVRDISRDLGKETEVVIQGQEVELDKTIIEAIADPLTHLVRNAVDHGLETPELRQQAGKNPVGILKLSACHEAGQVNIEISDDGAGINSLKIKEKALSLGLYDKLQLERMTDKELVGLIFEPGFSTSRKVTDVSGRGVGLDVVLTNLSKLNGGIDIETRMGRGTTFRIKLPLTLAIIPSLIVSVNNGYYAIPQANLVEVVGISPAQVKNTIDRRGTAQVMHLREKLLPLTRLSDVLGLSSRNDRTPDTEAFRSDRQQNKFDRQVQVNGNGACRDRDRYRTRDPRFIAQSFFNIVVVDAGDFHYGLIVDKLLDTEEIVVKPLGRHLKNCKAYAGATIQGDGRVALILDIPGISKIMDLAAVQKQVGERETRKKQETPKNFQSLLIVRNAPREQFAIPLGLVTRIEKINKKQIKIAGGRKNIKYRGENLPLCSIEEVAEVRPREDPDHFFVVVFLVGSQEIGLTVSKIMGIVDVDVRIDEKKSLQPGILGSMTIMNETTSLIDLTDLAERLMPEGIVCAKAAKTRGDKKNTILVVEDSKFYRNQIKKVLEDGGYHVVLAEDGLLGLEALEKYRQEIKLVLTDINMPRLDGLGLTEEIRKDRRFEKLPVIAVTSLAGKAHEKKGYSAGVDEYLIKFNRQQVLERIEHYLTRSDRP